MPERPDRPGGGDRPGLGDRPVQLPERPGRPDKPDRPDWGERPGWPGYRPPGYRPPDYRPPYHGGWYHGSWHFHWHGHGRYWPASWWWYRPGYWAAALPWNWGYWTYTNPYCGSSYTIGGTVINYAQPIATYESSYAAAAIEAGEEPSQVEESATDKATGFFEAAREAFIAGDYPQSLDKVNQAISHLPNDAVLHEFRSLVLFAQGDYSDAAAGVHAVLSAGPGWDWTTLSSFYADTDVYTEQLRKLEDYRAKNRDAADARFLLAYHYITCGHNDAALRELRAAVKLTPNDPLASELLQALEAPEGDASTATDEPPPVERPAGAPEVEERPLQASELVGKWTAKHSDGSTITLDLTGEGKFTWTFSGGEPSQAFSGTYTFADDLLVLRQSDDNMMIGQLKPLKGGGFNFTMTGGAPNDPGLDFVK